MLRAGSPSRITVSHGMVSLGLRIAAALVLGTSAALKLAAPERTSSALATFGLRSRRQRWVAWAAAALLEAAISVGVLAGSTVAAYAGAALMLALAAALALALARGRTGQPCGCFGAGSRVTPAALVRNLALAALLLAAAVVPRGHPTTEQWLGLGLVVSLLAIAGLVVAVLALARQVGELRLAVAPQAALELAEEGPEIGERTDLIDRFGTAAPGARLALAVFSSDGCPVCASVEPAVKLLDRDPAVAVLTFDEVRDHDAWQALAIPGAPFAVALGRDGTVLAKGTFNNLPQLESVLGTAASRAREVTSA